MVVILTPIVLMVVGTPGHMYFTRTIQRDGDIVSSFSLFVLPCMNQEIRPQILGIGMET